MRGSQTKMSMDSNEKTVFKTVFTGLDEFDRFTGGLKRGQVTVLAARPAMGKTTFALNAAWNVCQKEAVAYFSLDYSKTQLVGRLLCMISGAGNANKAGWVKIANAAESISHSDLIIDDDQDNSVETIASKCENYVKERDVSLIIVDYIQLVSYKDGIAHSRSEEVNTIVCELKRIAEELNVPVLLLCQIGRACEKRKDHRPILKDFRDSKALVDLADVVIFLYRDDYYHEKSEKAGKAELIVAKHPELTGDGKTLRALYNPGKGFGNV